MKAAERDASAIQWAARVVELQCSAPLSEARMRPSFSACVAGIALACLVASATAGAPGLFSGGKGLRLIRLDGAHGGAQRSSLLLGSRNFKGDALALRIKGGGGSIPPPVASGPQTPAEGKVKIKMSINYGVDGGSIVAVGPHQSFGNGDIHKGMYPSSPQVYAVHV